ncbi:calcium-dependent protein kinase 7, putative [Plasmodium chabaudi chabaudi]|uniref:non-specific serine/threonine protein kinase n=1 Tax=Plasmodium chabaudi chabaudi TaxID=31271 RepID=A0A4V6M9C7_PLACU|nr:calcium-dependent protein kinase 7, putative [Plasmodium chabaudi chabaudi]VTZ68799.1 calcium-dependent protein kinase 7, putative [Plasmodium chabaudi chabaudi]|eukprot:XP_016655378.1 calcium-dependent protein kinase 7, putative [Plasmodium chabaudi chabaudi]
MGLQTEKDKEKDDPKKNYKLCSKKFETDELEVLKKIYKELGSRSISNHIDKETFLQFFPLPGLWGERLFLKFNFKNTGYIDFEEFIIGIAICCRGTKSDKINVLFDIFDLNSDGYIQKSEMVAMLSNIPYIHKLKNIFFKKSNSSNYYDDKYEGNSNGDHNESYNDGYNDDYNYVDYYDYNQNNNNNNIAVNNNNQQITNNNANYSDSYNEYCDSEHEDEYNDDKNENNDENYYFDKMPSEKKISNDSANLKDMPQGNCSKCLKQKNRMMYNDKLLSMKEIAKKIRKEKKHHLEKCIKDIRRERYGNDLGNQRSSNTIRKNSSIITNNSISNCKKDKKNLINKAESDDNNSNSSSSSVSNVFTNEDCDFHNLCKKRIVKNRNRKKGSNSMQYLKNTNSAFMSSTSDSSYSYETISRIDSDEIDSFSSNKEQRNGSGSGTSDSFISIYGYLIKSRNRTDIPNKKRKGKHELDHRLLIEKRKNSWHGSIRSKYTQDEKDKDMEGKESEEVEKKKKSQAIDNNSNNNSIERKESGDEKKDQDTSNNKNNDAVENKENGVEKKESGEEKKDQDASNNKNNDAVENKDNGVEKRESNWEKKETIRSSYNRSDVNIYKKEKKIEKKRKLFSNEYCLPSKTARNILNDEENEEYSDKNVDVEEIVDIMLEECEFMDNDKITQIQFKSVIHKYDFFLYVFFSCLHEDIWGLQGNVLYGRDYISNFVIKPENFKNKQIDENDEIITEDLYFKIRQLFIVQAPDYDCVNDNLCVNFLKEKSLTNNGIDYPSDDHTDKKKKVTNEPENNNKTKEETSKDAEKGGKNDQPGQAKENNNNANNAKVTQADINAITTDKECKIYALEDKDATNNNQTIIEKENEKEKREDELVKEGQLEIKIQDNENKDTHEIIAKEITEPNNINTEEPIKREDISQNNSDSIINVNNANSLNPNDKENYAEKEGSLNENKNDMNILPKIGSNTKLVIPDNITQTPGYECDFNLLTNSMNDIFSKEIVEFIQASKISFNISDVRKERNPQHKDKHKKTKRNVDKVKNDSSASLTIKKKQGDDPINNNPTFSDTEKENLKKTTNNDTEIVNEIISKKEIEEKNILENQNINDNDTNQAHLDVDSDDISKEIKKSIVAIKMESFVKNSEHNKTVELKDANISTDQPTQHDSTNANTELSIPAKVENDNKQEEIPGTSSDAPLAAPVVVSSDISTEPKVAKENAVEKPVEEQKSSELANEIDDKNGMKVKKEESSSNEDESCFFEGKKKKKKNDVAKKHVKDSNLYSCPNCKGPFLMCPNCHSRYPRFCVKEDKIAMECEYCDCEHCYFYKCIYCNFDFQKCLNMVKKNSLKEGILYKIGKHLHQFKARYYILFDSLLYYYDKKNNLKPRGFMFLEGCYVEVIPKNDSINKYGFSICHKGTNQIQKRNLYVNTHEEREEWLQALYSTTKQNTLYNLYEIHEQLGQGKFSTVYRGINKQTNSEFAIKVINNRSVSIYEKELLRSEISILRLLRHPNVIFLKEIINTKETLYISMELVKGGELYDFLLSETRLSEIHANKIISQLIKTVAYLHKCGIIHRDIKPENILLTDKSKDAQIKLTDFGLSTLCAPNELLKEPCGTLAYVAPEVITLQGYNHKVDAWSIGVILYLLLSGKLPFPINKNTEMNIQKTYVLSFRDNIWKTISSSAKDLISKLLELNAEKRISASEALEHIWIKNPTAVINENSVIYKNEEINILNLQDVSVSTFNIPKYAPYHAEQKKVEEEPKNENAYSFHQENNMICENNYSNDDPIIPLPYSGSMIKETTVDKNPALSSNDPNSDNKQGVNIENMDNSENCNTGENKTNTNTRDNEQSKDDSTNV